MCARCRSDGAGRGPDVTRGGCPEGQRHGSFLRALFELFLLAAWLGTLTDLVARGKGMPGRRLEEAKQAQAVQAEQFKSVAGSTTASMSPTRSLRAGRSGRVPMSGSA